MEYMQRLILAQAKHPDILVGLMDCCVQHDSWCRQIKRGGRCDCHPEVTVTTKGGKYSVLDDGTVRRLGIDGEAISMVIDPRRSENN